MVHTKGVLNAAELKSTNNSGTNSLTGYHFIGKLSVAGQPTRPTQPFILLESINE